MSKSGEFRPDLKGVAHRAFRRASQQTVRPDGRYHGNAFQIYEVERKAAALREKCRAHFAKHKDRWVEKEFGKLLRQNPLKPAQSLEAGPKAPGGISNHQASHRSALMTLATANVELRQQRRLHNIQKLEHHQIKNQINQQTRNQRQRTLRR